ncbi:hypothetical protein [Celerinatantimonas sp. YJH-8]|uniref:hypothetical protein n=1 Tax=Celerinatantimonas sp. YJH-8 TaxID=3228714 RepID=UPI0038C45A6A
MKRLLELALVISWLFTMTGCVQQSIHSGSSQTATAQRQDISAVPHTIMVSSDRRYPLPVGSLIRFSPMMVQALATQPIALQKQYQWLSQELQQLLNYRGFVVTENNATLYLAVALYQPPIQSNTDQLEDLYKTHVNVQARQPLSLLLRIYRRGALDPLWQGAVDDYMFRDGNGSIHIDQKQARDTLIRLLRTIPMQDKATIQR